MLRIICILILFISVFSCSPDKETVVNEIIIRDTVYINSEDTLNPELGGLKLSLDFWDEFQYQSNTIIEGTEIKVNNVDGVNISDINENREVFIDGLVSGRTYGIDIIHKGSPLAVLKADKIGSNVYLNFEEIITIIDISKSEIQSVQSSIEVEFDQIKGVNFSGLVKGLESDSSFTRRGMVVFFSSNSNVDPVNHKYAYGNSALNDGTNMYNPNFLVPVSFITRNINLKIGDTLFYSVHGGSGSQNSTNEFISGYWSNGFNDLYLGFYPNVNPKGIKGWIIWEK